MVLIAGRRLGGPSSSLIAAAAPLLLRGAAARPIRLPQGRPFTMSSSAPDSAAGALERLDRPCKRPRDGDGDEGAGDNKAQAQSTGGGTTIVTLNVGGTHYATALETLANSEPGSMLHSMFSGNWGQQLDTHGRVFIDRDGERVVCRLSHPSERVAANSNLHPMRTSSIRRTFPARSRLSPYRPLAYQPF